MVGHVVSAGGGVGALEGLLAQQADVAAADIAGLAGARIDVKPYQPVLRGRLLTGDAPAYLQRGMRMPLSSQVSSRFLWWPAHKVAGRHLGPYLTSFGRAR